MNVELEELRKVLPPERYAVVKARYEAELAEGETPAAAAAIVVDSTSTAAELLFAQIADAGLPEPEREVRIHPGRRWKADYAYTAAKLVIEVEGGVWMAHKGAKRCDSCGVFPRGRHLTPEGFERDAEKYNAFALLGYRVLRFTSRAIRSGRAIEEVRLALKVS